MGGDEIPCMPIMEEGTSSVQAFLATLSPAQHRAATAPADVPLQILAGPGSGKTRVLVARVAWLIEHENISPMDLVVVTFTNKAAGEMRKRLTGLIGSHHTQNLILGTFHAMCARYLRRYASVLGLSSNFTILDADEAKKAIKEQIKRLDHQLSASRLPCKLKPETCMAEISRAKSKNMSPNDFKAYLQDLATGHVKANNGRFKPESTEIRNSIAIIYEAYQEFLQRENAMDFDDLLFNGLRLFQRKKNSVVSEVKHVLVDEFQDTNTIQYEILSELGGPQGSRYCVTVVGDPDQSIYGWRSAEVGNLALMESEFSTRRKKMVGESSNGKQVQRAFLEENYRSTGRILEAAKGIIEGDSNRIERDLFTSHPMGPEVILKQHGSGQVEASFVATEIKRLIAYSGGMLDYDDFAVLLRYNALSREVERQFQHENIPSRMMGGARFFERKEVKDILAYLTLAENPDFTPALERVINVPKRAIGDKTVVDLKSLAEGENVRTMRIVKKIANADVPIYGVKKGTQAKLREFVSVVDELGKMAKFGRPVSDIMERLIKRVKYKEYLQKESDFDQRWENVKELINFSALVALSSQDTSQLATTFAQRQEETEESYDEDDDYVDGENILPIKEEMSSSRRSPQMEPTEQSISPNSATIKREEGYREVRNVDRSSFDGLDSKVEEFKSEAKAPGLHTSSGSSLSRISNVTIEAGAEIIDLATSDEEELALRPQKRPRQDHRAPPFEGKQRSRVDNDAVQRSNSKSKSELQVFLEASTLSTDLEQDEEDGKKAKVTIATTHSAKGLEFPVVFIIAVEAGTYPFFRCTTDDEINEEVRTLYVAATRAQALLYLSYCSCRMVNGETMSKSLSPFVARIADASKITGGSWRSPGHVQSGGFVGYGGSHATKKQPPCIPFSTKRPELDHHAREQMAAVLGRDVPAKMQLNDLIAKFERSNTAAMLRQPERMASLTNESNRSSGLAYSSPDRFGFHSQTFGSSNRHDMSGNSGRPPTSLITPKLSSVGIQASTSAFGLGKSPKTSSNTSKSYDEDGWAIQTTSAGARASFKPPGPSRTCASQPNDRKTTTVLRPAPSFTEQYRMSSNENVHTAHIASQAGDRPKADLASFQDAHNAGLSSIMSLLPGDNDGERRSSSHGPSSSRQKKRLGAGRGPTKR